MKREYSFQKAPRCSATSKRTGEPYKAPKKTDKFLARFWRDEGAAIGVEYAVLLTIIGFGMTMAAGFVAVAISNALTSAASCLNTGTGCVP